MKVTVCEMNAGPDIFPQVWANLAAHAREVGSELVLLPELPFSPWFARTPDFVPERWEAAVRLHAEWCERLPELAPAVVLATRPVTRQDGRRVNEGFLWTSTGGLQPAHTKHYLPDEEGFWEASWYGRGEAEFRPFRVGAAKTGFLICTELWFFERARAYGQEGVHLLACPRATLGDTREKWLVGGRAAAVVSGAFCLSSNHVCPPDSEFELGGQGWIIAPDGEVLALTSPAEPFITREIDLGMAERAKSTYPRYVVE